MMHLRGILAIALVVVSAAVGAGAVVFVYRATAGGERAAADETTVRGTVHVRAAMRDLARLESAEFHMQRVIDLRDRQSRLFGLIDAEDAILLVAAADVVAGVDLAEMADGDIVVDEEGGAVTVTLPPPKVLGTRIDGEQTFVHARTTDVMARRSESLESRARQVAEDKLREAAIAAGLLERARRNAGVTVRTLLGALGFETVTIRWADEE
jgi:hypothetical protein